jgi:hypothetical protein
VKISTILDKIDERQLFVPAFQREYVWKREDAKQLLDSLIKEYPTGTLLTWETSNPPELKGPYKYDEKQGAVRLLLDGQQRVTTLYMLIRGEIPPYYSQPEITHDTRGLYVNVETLELAYYSKMRMENDPRWQDITDVLQDRVSAFDLQAQFAATGNRELGMEELKRLNENINAITRILDRDFPEQTIPVRASIREAIDIFYKVNASGVSLTDAELALAQISGYWPQARDAFKRKLADLKAQGFVFRLDFIVYLLLGCLYHLGSDMRKLHGADNDARIREAWVRLDGQVLDYVVNLLRTHAYVDHTAEINSVYALIPIIVYCYQRQGEHLSDLEIRKMVKWFYYSQIRARYTSQLQQKLDRDLRVIRDSEHPFDELLTVIEQEQRELKITPQEFAGHAVQHPLFSLMRWYFKSRNAVCFTTGLGLRRNMGAKYQLENDHIFPFSRLKAAGYGRGNRLKYALAQEFTNRAILTQVANRTKSDATAADYLTSVQERFPNALKLQCIPEDPELWHLERYEDFLSARRRLLADELNAFLEGITETEAAASAADIEDLIAEGESDGLEFKSSLRWDYRAGGVNKKLEDVVVKTVSAFANAEGGTLLIGVDDEGTVLGLENDYAALAGDRDKFELHLRNLLNQQLGKAFVASKVTITFPAVGDVEVCQVDVSRADQPLVLRQKDKSDQVAERLYVRSGNSSQEIPLSEAHKYFSARFG